MMDLKLNEMDVTTSFSEEELFDAIHEYYEAAEELSSAEQELFEINRACENLEAIKAAVEKYGWNDIINDLFGDQLSCETLDSSCEGAFDKIKKVAGKVANKFKAMIGKLSSMFRIHAAMFKDAAKYFKNKPDSTTSTEAATPQSETRYIDLKDLETLMDETKVRRILSDNMKQLGRIDSDYMNQHIEKHCKAINLSSLDNFELSRVLEAAGTMLSKQNEERMQQCMSGQYEVEEKHLRELRSAYRRSEAIEYDRDNPAHNNYTKADLHYRATDAKKDIARSAWNRAHACIWRVLYNRVVVSIRLLKAEITKRGYSSSH